jgi:hypothetical protein
MRLPLIFTRNILPGMKDTFDKCLQRDSYSLLIQIEINEKILRRRSPRFPLKKSCVLHGLMALNILFSSSEMISLPGNFFLRQMF